MILCEWDAPEGHPGQCCVHLYARILSTSFISVSIFSVLCYSSISISVILAVHRETLTHYITFKRRGRGESYSLKSCNCDVLHRRIGADSDKIPENLLLLLFIRPKGDPTLMVFMEKNIQKIDDYDKNQASTTQL